MAKKIRKTRALTQDKELEINRVARDTRTFGERLADGLKDPLVLAWTFIVMGILTVIIPALLIPMILIWSILMLVAWGEASHQTLPLKLPNVWLQEAEWVKRIPLVGNWLYNRVTTDWNDPKPGWSGYHKARGEFMWGNESGTNKELYLTSDEMLTHMLIFGTTGAGKAQPLDAKVLTPDGWKRMGDIKVGDQVVTPSGEVAPVLGVFPQGEVEIFRVNFADGRSTEACGEHLWKIHHKHWRGKYKKGVSRKGMAKPRILSTNEIVEIKNRNKGVFSIDLVKPGIDVGKNRVQDFVIHPYVMGALLGDGNWTGRNLRFFSTDKDIVQRIETLLPEDCAIKKFDSDKEHTYWITINQDYHAHTGRTKDGSYVTRSIRKALDDYGLLGTPSEEKFIPDDYLDASYEVRMELIRGLMDTDGTCDHRKVSLSFSSSSKRLAEQFAYLVRSVGGIAKIRKKEPFYYGNDGEKIFGKTNYIVSVSVQNPEDFFYCKRKRVLVEGKGYQYAHNLRLAIESIEPVGRKEAQCIYVGHPDHLYITDDFIVTHNTESLLSIGWNAISMGTGLFYSDAKGTNKLAFQLWSMARAVGRDDDFLLINYMTGNAEFDKRSPERRSNTVNPFTYGTSDFLADIVNSLAISSDGDDKNAVFTDGAVQLMKSLMVGLVEMRNQGRINLSVRVIREWLSLDKCIEIANDESLSDFARETMREYLNKIPGFVEGKSAEEQGEKTLEQFGYNQFYFRRALSMLSDSYGHIYGSLTGEVDFRDIVMNRRIVCVTLPALEKAPNELQQLGKIILAGLRSAMSMGLGVKTEGTKENAIDALPSASEKPSLYILDEYGYQAVDGFAVTAAQARGLGCSVIFAGQDYAGFKRGNEREAEQVVANTKFKSVMALEDPQSTWQLIKDLAGEGIFSEVDGFELGTETGAYNPGTGARVGRTARIDMQDLRQQIEGDFHLFYKDGIFRGSMFHAGPDISGGMQINQLVEIKRPDAEEISNRYFELRYGRELFRLVANGTVSIDRKKANLTPKELSPVLTFLENIDRVRAQEHMGIRETMLGLILQEQLEGATGGENSEVGHQDESEQRAGKPGTAANDLEAMFEQDGSGDAAKQSEQPKEDEREDDEDMEEGDDTSVEASDLKPEQAETDVASPVDMVTATLMGALEGAGITPDEAELEAVAEELMEGGPEYPVEPKPRRTLEKKNKAADELMSMLEDV